VAHGVVELAEVVLPLEAEAEQLPQLVGGVAELHRGGVGQIEPGDERGVAPARIGHGRDGEGREPVARRHRAGCRGDLVIDAHGHLVGGDRRPPELATLVDLDEHGAQVVVPALGPQEAHPVAVLEQHGGEGRGPARLDDAGEPAGGDVDGRAGGDRGQGLRERAPGRGVAQHEHQVVAVGCADDGRHQLHVGPGVVTAAQPEGHDRGPFRMVGAERDAVERPGDLGRVHAVERGGAEELLLGHAEHPGGGRVGPLDRAVGAQRHDRLAQLRGQTDRYAPDVVHGRARYRGRGRRSATRRRAGWRGCPCAAAGAG
jgi:hypothetical protein